MKKYLCLIGVFFCFIEGTFAQRLNEIKVNLAGVVTGMYSFQYERKLSNVVSFNNTFFYRPKTEIPFGTQIDNIAKDYGVGLTGIRFDYIYMNEAQLGTKGYSPELRFHIGKKQHRPFIGLFGMFQSYDVKVPALVEVLKIRPGGNLLMDVKLPINFTFNSTSGGLLVGHKFEWDRVALDLVILGPHVGIARNFYASGQNENITNLTDAEKRHVKNRIEERFGLRDKYFDLQILDDQAEIKSIRNVPFAGIRGFGVNLSYKF